MGASDLAQLSHLALVVMGEGRARIGSANEEHLRWGEIPENSCNLNVFLLVLVVLAIFVFVFIIY